MTRYNAKYEREITIIFTQRDASFFITCPFSTYSNVGVYRIGALRP